MENICKETGLLTDTIPEIVNCTSDIIKFQVFVIVWNNYYINKINFTNNKLQTKNAVAVKSVFNFDLFKFAIQ